MNTPDVGTAKEDGTLWLSASMLFPSALIYREGQPHRGYMQGELGLRVRPQFLLGADYLLAASDRVIDTSSLVPGRPIRRLVSSPGEIRPSPASMPASRE